MKIVFIALTFVCSCMYNLHAHERKESSKLEEILKQSTEKDYKEKLLIIENTLTQMPRKEAFEELHHLLEVGTQLNHYNLSFDRLLNIATNIYAKWGIQRNLLLYCLSVVDNPKFQKKEVKLALLSQIGNIYYSFNDFANTNFYLQQYITIDSTETSRRAINVYTTLGLVQVANQNFNKALWNFEKALYKAKKGKEIEWIGLSSGNIGNALSRMRQYKLSNDYLRTDIAISLQSKYYISAALAYSSLGYNYLQMDELVLAKKYFDSAQYYLNSNNPKNENTSRGKAILYDYLAEYNERINNYKLALYYHKKNNNIRDSINKKNIDESLSLQLGEINESKKEQQAVLLQSTLNEKKQNEITFVFIICSIIIILVFLSLLLKQKNKLNTLLLEKNNSIEKEKNLIEQRKNELIKLNETKSKLFSIVAHDLRSPIGNLQGLISMLENGIISKEEFLQQLPDLNIKVETLFGTIDNLLNWTFSQMEGIKAKPEKFNLYELCNNVINFLQPIANKKSIQLINAIQPTQLAFADKNQIEIVIRNLMSNAIKFSSLNTSITINIIVKPNEIIIQVKDQGIGLSDEKMKLLFEPKNSVSNIGTQGEKGIGLGLIICKEFVTTNGGIIWVEKNEPKGSIFQFSLPQAL